jgi:hypothetical protein
VGPPVAQASSLWGFGARKTKFNPHRLKRVLLARAREFQELRKFYDQGQIVELTLAICMANFTNCFKDALENISDLGVQGYNYRTRVPMRM